MFLLYRPCDSYYILELYRTRPPKARPNTKAYWTLFILLIKISLLTPRPTGYLKTVPCYLALVSTPHPAPVSGGDDMLAEERLTVR